MGLGEGLVIGDRVGNTGMRTDRVVGENMRTGGGKMAIDTTTIIMAIRHKDITTITTITIKEMSHLQTGEDMTPIITTITTTTDLKEETVMMMTTITTITIITKTLETDKTDSFPTTTMRDNNNKSQINESNQTPQGAYH